MTFNLIQNPVIFLSSPDAVTTQQLWMAFLFCDLKSGDTLIRRIHSKSPAEILKSRFCNRKSVTVQPSKLLTGDCWEHECSGDTETLSETKRSGVVFGKELSHLPVSWSDQIFMRLSASDCTVSGKNWVWIGFAPYAVSILSSRCL